MRISIVFASLLVTVLLTGCGAQDAPAGKADREAAPEETSAPAVTQAPPRDAEEAAADKAKKRAAEQKVTAADSPSSFEVVSVADGTTAYEGSQGAADVYVTNPHEEDMQALTDRLLTENPEYDMITASFYQEGFPMSTETLIGVRYAFVSPEGEQKFMGDVEGSIDDLIAEQCAEWTPEDVELLGPPPAEWNCEQYAP